MKELTVVIGQYEKLYSVKNPIKISDTFKKFWFIKKLLKHQKNLEKTLKYYSYMSDITRKCNNSSSKYLY